MYKIIRVSKKDIYYKSMIDTYKEKLGIVDNNNIKTEHYLILKDNSHIGIMFIETVNCNYYLSFAGNVIRNYKRFEPTLIEFAKLNGIERIYIYSRYKAIHRIALNNNYSPSVKNFFYKDIDTKSDTLFK